ncbi:MAG TPA: endonuclease/exonuclease/phosphatase family protein [Pseudolysinimonas sp.]|nr:endonuclease/exonuclease/phosphatase family protein [Pseudolysinimonas sp.]
MFRRILAAAVLVATAGVLTLAVWPQLFGLERTPLVAQVVSLRGLAIVVAAVLVVVLIVIALATRAARRFSASLAVMLIVFGALTLALLGTRGAGGPGFETAGDSDITVLSWNTLGDAPGAGGIAALALAEHADIVVLPETSAAAAEAAANVMMQRGQKMQVLHLSLDKISKARTTSLLISARLGSYKLDDSVGTTHPLPSLLARPTDGTGPVIVAAHPVAPVPGEMAHWRAGLTWLADRCELPNVIVAGDLNSTLDHYSGLRAGSTGDLGDCRDAALATGNAAVGTWPTALPSLIGAPIDHVLASDGWKVTGFRVIASNDGSGSDHRPVVAQLHPLR